MFIFLPRKEHVREGDVRGHLSLKDLGWGPPTVKINTWCLLPRCKRQPIKSLPTNGFTVAAFLQKHPFCFRYSTRTPFLSGYMRKCFTLTKRTLHSLVFNPRSFLLRPLPLQPRPPPPPIFFSGHPPTSCSPSPPQPAASSISNLLHPCRASLLWIELAGSTPSPMPRSPVHRPAPLVCALDADAP